MKKYFVFLCLFMAMSANAQNVHVEISSGVYVPSLKNAIEKNASSLLSEINQAQQENRDLNFSGISITDDAIASLTQRWKSCKFFCIENHIYKPAIQLSTGYQYQIRGINIELTPSKSDTIDETYKEVVIEFDKNGYILSFNTAIERNMYDALLREGKEVEDRMRREIILRNVEYFRTAYDEKDIKFLSKIFSDDALIVTGKVLTPIHNIDRNIRSKPEVIMVSKSKTQYLKDLENVFEKNRIIKVEFENIEIYKHKTKSNIYAVSLRQKWNSQQWNSKYGYSDTGHLFLLWNFKDRDNPEISVRVWEPENAFIKGRKWELKDVDLTDY